MTGHRNFASLRASIAADPEREARVAKRKVEALEEIGEYEARLADLRKARELTQTALAMKLGISQPEISRVEHQADVYISTLRKYIEAVGGDLEICAVFDSSRVKLLLGDIALTTSAVPDFALEVMPAPAKIHYLSGHYSHRSRPRPPACYTPLRTRNAVVA